MPVSSPSILVVPLASNAHGLLSGAPIEAVRHRLKVASLLYDQVFLEFGTVDVHAGPGGSFVGRHPEEVRSWQTAQDRHRDMAARFSIAMGREQVRGVPARTLTPVLNSATTVHWVATLEPFRSELPVGCDWIEFRGRLGPLPTEVTDLSRRWSYLDRKNELLSKAFPEHFVRDQIISNANEDAAVCAMSEVALSADSLHSHVMAARLGDVQGWKMQGFAIPILVPSAGDLPWEAIKDLRRDGAMKYLRRMLNDIETDALSVAADAGDLERAVHTSYERRLSEAVGLVEGMGSVLRKSMVGFAVGGGGGLATACITGPLGIIAGSGVGTALGAALDLRTAARNRRSRAWITAMGRLQQKAATA